MNLSIKTFALLWIATILIIVYSSFSVVLERPNNKQPTKSVDILTSADVPPSRTNKTIAPSPAENSNTNFLQTKLLILITLFLLVILVGILYFRKNILQPLNKLKKSYNELATKYPKAFINSIKSDDSSTIVDQLTVGTSDAYKRLSFSQIIGKQGWFDIDPLTGTIIIGNPL